MSRELSRLFAVAGLSFRSSLAGRWRLLGLGGIALVPTAIVAAVAAAHPAVDALANAAEGLFAVLTLPVVVMVVVLVIAVAQFRNEIDAETLVYLSGRSVGRPTLVVGKYLGALGASLVLVVPASLLPLGVALAAGAAPYAAAVPAAVLGAALLGTLVYVGVFLLLGLVTRSALLVGLLFGFLWEELLPLLPGEAPRLTLIFYLRSFLSAALPSGPLSGYPSAISLAAATVVLLGVTVGSLVLGSTVFGFLETAPERASG